MRNHQQLFIQLLTDKKLPEGNQEFQTELHEITAVELANYYVKIVFLSTALKFIQEQYWIANKDRSEDLHFGQFVKKFFKSELSPILFLHSYLEQLTVQEIEDLRLRSLSLQPLLVDYIKSTQTDIKLLLSNALRLISDYYEFEYQLHMKKNDEGSHLGFSLYRTFDVLDELFNLDFKPERKKELAPSNERLFFGSGVAAQSSYMTILMFLKYIKINSKSSFVDLGSGFGRVGMVVGLLRPDISFKGYEFVEDRVAMANASSEYLQIDLNANFFHQDLSAADFKIPEADVYYLYDPFNADTYTHILEQLNVIGKHRKITVITKGDARQHFLSLTQRGQWLPPQIFEYADFCVFRSYGK